MTVVMCPTCNGSLRWNRCVGCERNPIDCICPRPLAMPEWRRRGISGENRGKILSSAA